MVNEFIAGPHDSESAGKVYGCGLDGISQRISAFGSPGVEREDFF